MNALEARNQALENHPLYKRVVAELLNAVKSSEFCCKIDVRGHQPEAVEAVITKLRSNEYSAEVEDYELYIEWSK
jgi:hypothetical protein